MQKRLSEEELAHYRDELSKLPIGSISRKTIAGKVRYSMISSTARRCFRMSTRQWG